MASELLPAPARITALADACVLCGLCLPHCPTYALDRIESESPRGRIMLMKALAEQRLEAEPTTLAHLDHCLACRNCERVCPAQVNYGELLIASRSTQRHARPPTRRMQALEWLFLRRARLDLGLTLARVLRLFAPRAWRKIPIPPRRQRFRDEYRPRGEARGRIMLFIGCLGRHYDATTVQAAITLLTCLGWHVVIPPSQQCCGALHRYAGATDAAAVLAKGNRQAFAVSGSSLVLSLTSGCHETIASTLNATSAAMEVRDVFEFLATDPAFADLRFRSAAPDSRVALHLPCTQRNVLRNAMRIAPLLQHIPGLTLDRLPESGCCGAAGTHMLLEPERAAALRTPLLDAVTASGATTLCTSNVGCRIHLAAGLAARGLAVRVRHPLELLAEHLS